MKLQFIPLAVIAVLTLGAATQTGGDARVRVKGGNGCTIVRKVTVFSLTPPPSVDRVPDEAMATLEQLRGGAWEPVASAALDADGRFAFAPLPAGEYRVCAQGPADACRTAPFRAPSPASGLAVSNTCPAPAGSDLVPAQLNVQLTPQSVGGDCATCGKSSTTSKNNAR